MTCFNAKTTDSHCILRFFYHFQPRLFVFIIKNRTFAVSKKELRFTYLLSSLLNWRLPSIALATSVDRY